MRLRQMQPAKGCFQTCKYEMCQDEASAKSDVVSIYQFIDPLLSDKLLPLIRGPIFFMIFFFPRACRSASTK